MKIDIKHLAQLANLPITEEKSKKLGKELEQTLEHIERLDELQTTDITPTSQVTGLENVMREDIITPSLSQEDALKNAKRTHNGFFVVDAILEN